MSSAGQAPPPPIPKAVTYICASCASEIQVPLLNGLLPASMQCAKCGWAYSFPSGGPQQRLPPSWTPEDVDNLIKSAAPFVNDLADKFLTYRREEAQADTQYLQVAGSHNRHLLYVLALFLSGLVVLMSYLVSLKLVSGDALLFLAGTITGYIIVLVQRLIRWTNPTRPRPED